MFSLLINRQPKEKKARFHSQDFCFGKRKTVRGLIKVVKTEQWGRGSSNITSRPMRLNFVTGGDKDVGVFIEGR